MHFTSKCKILRYFLKYAPLPESPLKEYHFSRITNSAQQSRPVFSKALRQTCYKVMKLVQLGKEDEAVEEARRYLQGSGEYFQQELQLGQKVDRTDTHDENSILQLSDNQLKACYDEGFRACMSTERKSFNVDVEFSACHKNEINNCKKRRSKNKTLFNEGGTTSEIKTIGSGKLIE